MVEWKKLGEFCCVHTGGQLNRSDMIDNGLYPVINGGRTPSGYTNSFNEEADSITISQGGESAGFVNWMSEKFWAGAHCYVVEHNENINGRFLYHSLKNIENVLQASKQGAGIPGLNRKTLYQQVIPIPSLSEQSHIVGILDTFTASIANLKEQIGERRKQYEHYRDQLLDLEGKEGVEMKTLGEIAPYRKSRIEYSLLDIHNYISVENLLQMKKGKIDAEKVPSEGNAIKYEKGDVLVGNIRPYLKKNMVGRI